MRKRRRRRQGPLSLRYMLLISTLIFIIMTAQGLWIIEKGIRPTILEIANLETQKVATSAINYAIKGTVDNVNMNELIDITYDDEGNISYVGFNAAVYNKVVTESVTNVQHYIHLMERGQIKNMNIEKKKDNDLTPQMGIIYMIPLGRATNIAILSQVGPKIPVKLTAIGDVDVELNEEVKATGINNTWIRVSLDLEVQVQVIIPFATYMDEVVTTIPIGMIYVPGKVPHFYSGQKGELPGPAILVDEEKN